MDVSRGVFDSNSIRLLGVLIALLALCQVGCDQGPEGDVLAQYRRSEDAIAMRDAVGLRNTLSTASVEYLNETLRLAREASEKETKEMDLERLGTVLALRNRAGAKLKTMDVDQFILWQMNEGLMYVDEEFGLVPYRVQINGTSARMQYGMKVEEERRVRFGRRGLGALAAAASGGTRTKTEPIDMYYHFENIGGFWYIDLTHVDPTYDDEIISEARAARLAPHQYLAQQEEEEHGSLIKNVWAPPK